ncbi:MAG: glycosyltransferase 87 family protein [Actinomycetota bacterium]|nr:glycosyltransferase 87 family protein [Actinomycetota bacterium]
MRLARPEFDAVTPWLAAAAFIIVLLPVSLKEVQWAYGNQGNDVAGDYHVAVYTASRDVLHGVNPYGPPDSPLLGSSVENYPPTIFVGLLPVNLPSWTISEVIWLATLAVMLVLTPALLGVRDPRKYAVWLFSAPAVAGMLWGNVTLALIFATALFWRWRDRPRAAGLVLGTAIAVKLLLAPLLLWLVFTRRYRAAAIAASSAVAMLLVAWAAISFHGMLDYPQLISTASRLQVRNGLLLSGLVSQLGAGAALAELVGTAAAAAIASVAWRLRRDERVSFALMVVALQFTTPIYHVFNLGFLVIPIALLFSRIDWPWVLLPTIWFVAHIGPLTTGSHVELSGAAFGTTLALAVAGFVLLAIPGAETAKAVHPPVGG